MLIHNTYPYGMYGNIVFCIGYFIFVMLYDCSNVLIIISVVSVL